MNKLRIGLKALVAIAVISAIMFAAPTIGRFVPTHKIVEPVFCASCHPEEAEELTATAHLPHFTKAVQDGAKYYTNGATEISDAEAITGGCTMCHNFWDNMKWFGVTNAAIVEVETDNPDPVTDIYGNVVSPYGLASTQSYSFQIQAEPNAAFTGGVTKGVEAWLPGIDTYKYTDADGVKHYRVDYVWSALSALSPGPVVFEKLTTAGVKTGCGTAEKGLCHISAESVALAATNNKLEFPDQDNVGDLMDEAGNPIASDGYTVDGAAGVHGNGVYFQHEMAYTTAQYAAKPVKLCGACHVFKLPPMKWGGEPWAGDDIKTETQLNINGPATGFAGPVGPGDPFGFTPTYDQSGDLNFVYNNKNFDVKYKTPDWAHQIVPCMRCHVHAGINGESVSGNK